MEHRSTPPTKKKKKKENVATVLNEQNYREASENNLLVFGLKELVSENREERGSHDVAEVIELFKVAKVTMEAIIS